MRLHWPEKHKAETHSHRAPTTRLHRGSLAAKKRPPRQRHSFCTCRQTFLFHQPSWSLICTAQKALCRKRDRLSTAPKMTHVRFRSILQQSMRNNLRARTQSICCRLPKNLSVRTFFSIPAGKKTTRSTEVRTHQILSKLLKTRMHNQIILDSNANLELDRFSLNSS